MLYFNFKMSMTAMSMIAIRSGVARYMKKKLRSIVQNSSLRSKIICIVLIAMILMTGVSAVCLKMTVNAGNAMFSKALAGSLSYTAGDIATKLSNIESMTNMIVTNSEIRKNLIILLDEEYEIKKRTRKVIWSVY